jgi:signal transduction histidine kinase
MMTPLPSPDSKLRILHLEDSVEDVELVRQILTDGGMACDIRRCESRTEFLDEVQKKDFDLIMADCSIPLFSGLVALEIAQEHAPEVPFIFVSGTIGEEVAIESLRNGATDYVLKQRLSRLVPAVRRAIAEVAERMKTREMEQRLRQAQRLEAVGTLAGGVAHDFNNILTIIKGHLSLLPMESHRPDRVQEIGATIDRAAQRGSELVKQLLAFARKSDGSFTSTDINHRVRDISTMLREAFPRNVAFELQLDEALPEILADPGQVERVLINLSTNARDAMPLGGTITFSTRRVSGPEVPPHASGEPNQEYLCLRVSDTGCGMDEATRQHIFEPFFTTKPKGKGTGLGMPVVYGLMQSHNGAIDVNSELGKGTAISLYFPIPSHATQSRVESIPEPSPPVGGSEAILVIDDETDVLYFLEIILQTQGYQVLSAPNAEIALEIFQTRMEEIQLVFSDIGLPRLDGFGLCAAARKLKPTVKTILASGYSDASLKTRMAEENIDGFLSKPYDMATLLQTIRGVLD